MTCPSSLNLCDNWEYASGSRRRRLILKYLKEKKLKVQSQIQGDQVRVTGKKRDDLQQAIASLRDGDFDLPLQFNNFRD